MTTLQRKLSESGKSMSSIAAVIGVTMQDFSHFVRGEFNRIGKARKKKIREWMVQNNYMQRRKERIYCICPDCQARHVKRKEISTGGVNQNLEK
jgi:predicted XRE-type DNA-binding protein